MDHAIPLHEWLRHLSGEYLSSFIRDGGAAVKFAVTSAGIDRRCGPRCRRNAAS